MRKDARTRLAEAANEIGIEESIDFLKFALVANKPWSARTKPARAEKEKQPKPAVKVVGAPRTE